jgi:hypothetical protein
LRGKRRVDLPRAPGGVSVFEEAEDGLLENAAGAWQGGFDRFGELFAKLGGTCSDSEQHRVGGTGSVESATQVEEFRRGDGVRGGGGAMRLRLDRGQADATRSGLEGRVDKENGLGGGDLGCQIGGPLLAGDYAHAVIFFEPLSGPFREAGPDTVITTKRIATGENKAAC